MGDIASAARGLPTQPVGTVVGKSPRRTKPGFRFDFRGAENDGGRGGEAPTSSRKRRPTSRLGIAVGAEGSDPPRTSTSATGEIAAVAATFSYLAERRLASIETLLRLSRLLGREAQRPSGGQAFQDQGRDAAALSKLRRWPASHRNVAFVGFGMGKTHLA